MYGTISGRIIDMKIKVAIANYGVDQLPYLDKVVEEFRKITKHQIDLIIYTTTPVEHRHILIPADIGMSLPFCCRDDMAKELADYDLFIYNENDMLITEDNIEAFIEHSQTLGGDLVSGFIRYETDQRGKILLDPNPHWGNPVHSVNQSSFQIHNVHQGCWVLLQKDLKKAINSTKFLVPPHGGPYGILEQGASDPYTQCGLVKVFPKNLELCGRLLIHHLPNKYIQKEAWIKYGIPLDKLLT